MTEPREFKTCTTHRACQLEYRNGMAFRHHAADAQPDSPAESRMPREVPESHHEETFSAMDRWANRQKRKWRRRLGGS